MIKILFLMILIFFKFSSAFAQKENGRCFFRPLQFEKNINNLDFNKDGYDKNNCRYGEVFIKFPNERMINPNEEYNKSKRWVLSKTENLKVLDTKLKRFIELDEFNFYVRSYKGCILKRKKQQKIECAILKYESKFCSKKYQPPFYDCSTSKKSVLYNN